ncbi:DUF2570 family protein [Gallibacterium salpingitidis]|uniref:DUF2570 family protein n=1 Tax=Gallibacterium salpingitidis TaxID=505341 RepID=UPI00082694E4
MFSTLTKILVIAILGLSILSWVQFQKLSSLKAENNAQAQIITQQSNSIKQLNADIIKNTQILNELTKQESLMRETANETIESISTEEKNNDCYRNNAPRSVINFLQQ